MNEIIFYKNEILRKIIHLTALIIPLIYYFFLNKREFVIFIFILLFITLIIDYLRINNNKLRNIFNFLFSNVLREREKNTTLNATTLLFGFFTISILFDKSIVIPSMIIALVSDSFAAIIGLKYGETKLIYNRTLEGTIVFNVVTFIILILFMGDISYYLILISSIIAIAELLSPSHLDNFTVPFISSILLYIL